MMYQVFLSILETFIVFGFGALAWKLRMIETGDLDKLSRLTLDMFFPMLTFSTITRTFDPNRLTELWVMPLLGIALMLFGAGAGWVFKRLMKSKGHGREGTFHHICAINNYVFLPIIVLQNIYGERHVALLLLMNVGSTIGFWTIGVLTLTGGGSLSKTMKSIFSINVAAVVAALLVSFLHIPLPEALNYTFQYLGNITVPLMLVVIGVALVGCFRGMLENWYDMLLLSVVRLVLIPVALLLLLRLLPLPEEAYQVAAVVALMPAASSSVLIAKRYGGDPDFAGRAIILTTLFSLGTIPLLMALFLPA